MYFRNERSYLYLYFAVAGSFIAIAVAIGVYEAKQWEKFAKEHDCKVIAKISGYSAMGAGSDGKPTSVYIPGRTTYHCNDGIDYTR